MSLKRDLSQQEGDWGGDSVMVGWFEKELDSEKSESEPFALMLEHEVK